MQTGYAGAVRPLCWCPGPYRPISSRWPQPGWQPEAKGEAGKRSAYGKTGFDWSPSAPMGTAHPAAWHIPHHAWAKPSGMSLAWKW